MEQLDIHNFSQRLKRAELNLEGSNPVSRRNADLILKFARHCATLGLGKPRITKYLGHLRLVAERLGKDFDRATREDIEGLVYGVHGAISSSPLISSPHISASVSNPLISAPRALEASSFTGIWDSRFLPLFLSLSPRYRRTPFPPSSPRFVGDSRPDDHPIKKFRPVG